jgi:hypothetical protein
MSRQISRHVAECNGRPLNYQIEVALFTQPFVNQHGKRIAFPQRPIRMLWYPWAIQCTSLWLARCKAAGAPHEEIVRTRRVLHHLVLSLGDESVREAKTGLTYAIAENLLALTTLDDL